MSVRSSVGQRFARAWCVMSAIAVVLLASATGGCQLFGYLSHVVAGGGNEKKPRVEPEYLDLHDKTIAVLVNADEFTLYEHPEAPLAISLAVSARLAVNVPGAKLVNPDQLVQWQRDNPYWNTLRYSRLIHKLNVDRIVFIDLVQYSTHEPGNQYVLRGMVVANVSVIEAAEGDGTGGSGDDFAYATIVRTQFPEDSSVGLLDSDEQTVVLGMLANFSAHLSDLFHEHKGVSK